MHKTKGGPGSGRNPSGSNKPQSTVRPTAANPNRDPSSYSEQPSASNPGKPRSGVSIRDLFPKRTGQTTQQLINLLRSPLKA